MSYSKSLDITAYQYSKLVPKFLSLLSKYSYSHAKIQSQIKLEKDDEIKEFSGLIVEDILKKLTKFKFHSGKILIYHKNKNIKLVRSRYTQDLTLELDFMPDSDLKADLEKLFPIKKKASPTKEADEIRKAAEKERKKEIKDRKKEYGREEKKIIVKSKEAEKKLIEAEKKRLKADKIYHKADKLQKDAERAYKDARKIREKKSKEEKL